MSRRKLYVDGVHKKYLKKQFYLTQAEDDYLSLIQAMHNLQYKVDALHMIIYDHHEKLFASDTTSGNDCQKFK